MPKFTKKLIPVSDLVVDYSLNLRDKNNYDTAAMKADILVRGRVFDPIFVRGEDNVVLRGNRRTLACQELLADPKTPAGVRDAIEKLECQVYTGLTDEEQHEMLFDHGATKGLSRSEIVQAVWRLFKQGYSEAKIIVMMYYQIARFTGQERNLHEVTMITDPSAREAALKKRFHGTIGNFLLVIARLGEFVRSQYILTLRSEEKPGLEPGEKVDVRIDRSRVTELNKARAIDEKADGWTSDGGGKEFNALLEKYRQIDAGTVTEEKKSRLTPTELKQRADAFTSPLVKKALLIAAGETDPKIVGGLSELDDRVSADQKKLELLCNPGIQDRLPPAVKDFVVHLLHDEKPSAFQKFLESILI